MFGSRPFPFLLFSFSPTHVCATFFFFPVCTGAGLDAVPDGGKGTHSQTEPGRQQSSPAPHAGDERRRQRTAGWGGVEISFTHRVCKYTQAYTMRLKHKLICVVCTQVMLNVAMMLQPTTTTTKTAIAFPLVVALSGLPRTSSSGYWRTMTEIEQVYTTATS